MANNSLKKKLKVLKSRAWFSVYNRRYLNCKIDENLVLLESRSGSDMAGNILYIARELSTNPEYKNFKLCIAGKPISEEKIKNVLKQYGVTNFKYVQYETIEYFKWASRAKYLVNDTSFPRRFIKKDGQVILNTWHGTPLKNMGRDVENEVYNMGNVMRNLVFADFLVFPNEYMKEKMVSAYMLENLSNATILNEGYPRNSVFFNTDRRSQLRKEFGVDDKKIIVYMPTWRGNVNKYDVNGVLEETTEFLRQMDQRLGDNQLLYVKYHPFMKLEINEEDYKHIKAFPSGYEYYEILNMADTLVTDYSSVFYDFANSRQKIVLYAYDKEEYFANRGVYVSLDEFPFPQATTVDELISAINTPKNYDDSEFIKTYCTYDSPDAVKRICQRVFLNKPVTNEEKIKSNGKENVLIYAGDMNKNGITTALMSVLNNIDLSKKNFYITFREKIVKADPKRTNILPKDVGVIPMSSDLWLDLASGRSYTKFEKTGDDKYKKQLEFVYNIEIQRHFKNLNFEHVIQFNGYERHVLGMFTQFNARKTVFVHNDMVSEIETKNNQSRNFLKWIYNVAENVVTVSEDIVEPTFEISGKRDNIKVISNFHNHDLVVEKGDMPLEFQSDTEIYCPHPNGINEVLNSDGLKFITIGRFSPEKGHFRLIDAFEEFHKNHPDSKLIIIGGLGILYNKTVQKVRKSECWQDIVLIKSMKNPMPILKKCDLFILSSIYEGLGLVMLEADSLGVPMFSTDVHGPSNFLKEFGGYLVEDSTEGILQGMNDFVDGKIKVMNVDYKKRNDHIRAQLEEII